MIEDFGFEATVFLSYDLLNTTYDEGLNNIRYCPAMRNSHIYGSDSACEDYKKDKCMWSNLSTFIGI